MGKRIHWNPGICFAAGLLLISLAGAGCGAEKQAGTQGAENGTESVQESQNAEKTGVLHYNYFFQEDGISLSSGERFLYSGWEPVEFDYICMDPACSHLTAGCSAHAFSNDGEKADDFSLIYEDRLIIVHAAADFHTETINNEDGDTIIADWYYTYSMDVYEADLDGSGRHKRASFPGSVEMIAAPHAAVFADGKLYFGGPTETRSRSESDAQGRDLEVWEWTSYAVYCLDLDDYTLETYAVTEDAEGTAYMFELYEYDGMIYAIVSNFQDDHAVWYRINPAKGECEEIQRFDSDVARFCGAIGDTVYYYYENSGETLYARDIGAEAEEREIRTQSREDKRVYAFILDGQILFQTDGVYEGEDRMTEYAVLDRDGNLLDTIRYDDYVTFFDVVGDKLIYFRLFSDCEEWWVNKEDFADLIEKGTEIGPFFGVKQDTLIN